MKPFLKWVGGKRRSLREIRKYVPGDFRAYHEPFLGGGALYFDMLGDGDARPYWTAYLADACAPLMQAYFAVSRAPDAVDARLTELFASDSREQFLAIRGAESSDPIEDAARFIYLNRAGYNGLWRVNRQGRPNMPYGGHRKPLSSAKLQLASIGETLRSHAVMSTMSVFDALRTPVRGDFVYLDPPYLGEYGAYHDPFTLEHHRQLRSEVRRLVSKGVSVLLSHSDHPEIRELYRGFHVVEYECFRSVSCKASSRGMRRELLVVAA